MRLTGETLLGSGEQQHCDRMDLFFTDAKLPCNLPKADLGELLKGEGKKATFKGV